MKINQQTEQAALLLSLIAIPLICVRSAFSDEPAVNVRLHKNGDGYVSRQESDHALIVVTTETGIGRMTLSPKDAIWPKDVTIRLRYSKPRPFKTLEGFEMTSSRMQVRGNSGDSGKVPFFLATDDGKFGRDDLNPSGWLKLEFKPHGDDLDIVFPSHLWRDEKEVQFQWIDFYRT